LPSSGKAREGISVLMLLVFCRVAFSQLLESVAPSALHPPSQAVLSLFLQFTGPGLYFVVDLRCTDGHVRLTPRIRFPFPLSRGAVTWFLRAGPPRSDAAHAVQPDGIVLVQAAEGGAGVGRSHADGGGDEEHGHEDRGAQQAAGAARRDPGAETSGAPGSPSSHNEEDRGWHHLNGQRDPSHGGMTPGQPCGADPPVLRSSHCTLQNPSTSPTPRVLRIVAPPYPAPLMPRLGCSLLIFRPPQVMIPDVQKVINQSGNVSADIFNTRLIKPPTSVLVFPLKVDRGNRPCGREGG
jgi:hypothetical protein